MAFQMAARCIINAYVDDFIVLSPRAEASFKFNQLFTLLDMLGFPMNPSKNPLCETYLGIEVNIVKGTLMIEPDKLNSIYQECCWVATKKSLSKTSYQSLIGKLIYIYTKCISG